MYRSSVTETKINPLRLPATGPEWVPFVTGRAAECLARVRAAVAELTDGAPRDAEQTLARWNEISLGLDDAGVFSHLMARVHPDPAVRSAGETCEQQVHRLETEIRLNRTVYEALSAIDASTLDDDARRVLSLALRDFRRAGVDRDEATRQRLRELSERQTLRAQQFAKNIADDVRSIRLPVERLAGLPQDFVDAHPADADGLVTITTDRPDYMPFRTFAADAAARRELTVQFLNCGWPDNDAVLADLLALRREQAQLLGYADWADYEAETKMVGSGAAIGEFIEQVRTIAKPAADRDYAVLLDRLRADVPDATAVASCDAQYYAELVRRERYRVDAAQVRRYFDFTKVRAGLLAVTGRLFGLEYREVDVPLWHEDVTAYDVLLDGDLLGRIYLDLHPRPGKFQHAAMFHVAAGITGRQLPEAALVCNFPRGLMQHDQVVTLFHEFGHLVHHVLAGRQRWARFSGVATEWDFVEAPSQLLEEWAWDADVLRTFATDETGEPIPVEMVTRMREAREFAKGCFVQTQMFQAALSYELHRGPVEDITALVRSLQNAIDVYDYIEGTHFHATFGHLTDYSAVYYTYMWSLAIAKDLLSGFDPANMFDTARAHRYRDTILARGGSADAADLVADFLGRPYTLDAFRAWLAR